MRQAPLTLPVRRGRAKWALGSALVVVGISGLALWGMRSPGAVSYYVTATEIASKARPAGATMRLGGRVAADSLVRRGPSVRFVVTDGRSHVPVAYTGEVPDTLKEGTDVVAEGTLGPEGTLTATRVLAKCSSRFVSREEQAARDRARRG